MPVSGILYEANVIGAGQSVKLVSWDMAFEPEMASVAPGRAGVQSAADTFVAATPSIATASTEPSNVRRTHERTKRLPANAIRKASGAMSLARVPTPARSSAATTFIYVPSLLN